MPAPQVTRLCVRALDVAVPLLVHGDALATAVAAAWEDARLRSTEADGETSCDPLLVAIGPSYQVDVAGADVDEVLHNLNHAVTATAITKRIQELVILRAAALADPATGAAVVLVASPGTGLTTVVRTLGTRWAVLGDETVGVRPDGSVVSVLAPLTTVTTGQLGARASMTSLGLTTTDRPCSLKGLFVLDRMDEHEGDPVVSRLATVDALGLLAAETRNLSALGTPLRMIADLVDHAGGAGHVVYREAATLEPLVRHTLTGSTG